jgi:tetratricopeptide (TPR) repeat protein
MASVTRDDLFFGDIVRSYVETPRFLKRDWLAKELHTRLDAPDCRFVLLVAEPGAGKSAFMAQLAHDHTDWPRFFIRRDQRTSMGESSGRSFLLRTGFQLAATWPALFELEQIRIEVEQRIGTARADVVGATVERIRASPFHQTAIHIKQDVQEAQGSVEGLRIGEWIADPRLIEMDDLQQMALYGPARSLLRLDPRARVVMLVDALDELRFGDENGNVLQWLANCPPLPANVRIVLSSRPSHDQLNTFTEKRRDALALLPLDAGDERVQSDIRAYASALVAPAEIATTLQETGRDRETFITELTTKADGNIGYAAALGRAFDQAQRAPEHRALLLQLLRLEHLPDDTRQLFAFFLQLIRTGPGQMNFKVVDRNTGRTAILEAWSELYRPILALLAIALSPLTLDQIHVLCGSLAERHQIAQGIGWLEQFLDRIGDRYRLYHATLASFLTDPTIRANAETSELWIDFANEHQRLAGVLEKGGLAIVWQDSPDVAVQGQREYARLHYVIHLYLGENWERLSAVIEEGEYGRGKLQFDRSAYLYSRDLDLAIRAVTREDMDEDARLAALSRLWSFKLLRCTLSSYAHRLPGAAFQALAAVGRDQEALDLAELITDPNRQALALAMIALAMAAKPARSARFTNLVRRAGEIGARIEDTELRLALVQALLRVARTLEPAAVETAAALQAPLGLARTFGGAADRADALARTAVAFQDAGRGEEAHALRSEIERLLGAPQDRESAQSVLYSHCVLSMALGDLQGAFASAEKMLDVAARLSILAQLAARLTPGTEAADATVSAIEAIRAAAPSGPSRTHADAVLADVFFAWNEPVRATELLTDALDQLQRDAPSAFDCSGALYVADVLQRANDATRFGAAVRLLRDAGIANAGERERGTQQAFTISLRSADAARALANLDQCAEALEVTRRMSSYERGSPLLSVVESLLRLQDYDQAINIADEIQRTVRASPMRVSSRTASTSYEDFHAAYLIISTALAAAGQWQRAIAVARTLGELEAGIDALSRIAILQFEAGRADDATRLVTEIVQHVRLSNARTGGDEALAEVAELLTRARQWPKARAIALEVEDRYLRSNAQMAIERALIEANKFDDAEQMLLELKSPSDRAESLLALIRKVYAVGGTPTRPIDNISIIRMLGVARAYAEEDDDKRRSAAALRAIARAFAELHTGDLHAALSTMRACVQAMNAVERFPFVPTPWCDTAVAFAELGRWDTAMEMAKWRVDTNPLDGCFLLCDLATFAGKRGDIERAKGLLVDARNAVERISIPPQQSDMLTNIAQEYARIGMLEQAKEVASASRATARAHARVAVALLQSGRVTEGIQAVDDLEDGAIDTSSYPLVNSLITAGEIDRAYLNAVKVAEPIERAERILMVAQAQIAAGRSSEARKMIESVSSLCGSATDSWSKARVRQVRQMMAALLAELGEMAAAERSVEQDWLAAPARSDLLALIPLAGPLVSRQPSLPERIHASLSWVEQTLLTV